MPELEVDVAVVGAGTAGRNAVREVARANKSFLLINGGPMGTTCARVGCMPSKVAIQVAEDFHRRSALATVGIAGGDQLTLDLPAAMTYVRARRDFFVGRVLEGTEKLHGGNFLDGYAELVEPTVLRVGDTVVRARAVVLATGSRPIVPKDWQGLGERILTSDELFEQEDFPARMAVIGLGVIGLEIGQTLARFGVDVIGFDALDSIGGLTAPDVAESARLALSEDFPIHLGHPVVIEEEGDGLRVRAGDQSTVVDRVLVAIGRTPNTTDLGLERFGVETDPRGVPVHDPETMRVGDLPIFLAGDLSGDRLILHEAAEEGRIAGINAAADQAQRFARKTPLAITFTDPNLCRVGIPWRSAEARGAVFGTQNFARQARSKILGKGRGLLRVFADPRDGRLLGAEMAAPAGEHLAHLLAWSLEANQTVFDLLAMPYYHPVVEEGLQGALTDLAAKVEIRPEAPTGLRWAAP